MSNAISAIDKIAQEKERLRLKERQLKDRLKLKEREQLEREKRKQSKGFINIGRLANEAGIASLEKPLLLGAFIEISEKCKDESSRDRWKKYANIHSKNADENSKSPVSVSLKEIPSADIKKRLRNLGFRWNEFRREFYGYAPSKDELYAQLKDLNPKIEIIL